MPDFAAIADEFVNAYNSKDFGTMRRLSAPDLDFCHFNRDFAFRELDPLLQTLELFAGSLMPDRHFEAPDRVTRAGNVVVREAWWTGTCAVDLPGFGTAGTRVRFKFCSILRFDDGGTLVEWKDFG